MTNTAPETPGVHSMGLGFEGTLKDMRFIGWVSMIYGILTCLSIAGAIVGVPLIIASHRFIEGINRFDLSRLDKVLLARGFEYKSAQLFFLPL